MGLTGGLTWAQTVVLRRGKDAIRVLTTFVIPRIAGDIRTAGKVSRDKKELKISLYELGYIKEEELSEIY